MSKMSMSIPSCSRSAATFDLLVVLIPSENRSKFPDGQASSLPGTIARNEVAVGSGAAAYLCLVDGCSKSLGSCSLEAESRAVTGRPVVAERGSACSGD